MLDPLEVLTDGVEDVLSPAGVLFWDRLALSLEVVGAMGGEGSGCADETGTASAAPEKPWKGELNLKFDPGLAGFGGGNLVTPRGT